MTKRNFGDEAIKVFKNLGFYEARQRGSHVALRRGEEGFCKVRRAISPLLINYEVDVIGMAPEEECEKEMFVTIQWGKEGLAVPLAQLTPINSTGFDTRQAVEDWHYWVSMGYRLC